jgi:hypothetical protein
MLALSPPLVSRSYFLAPRSSILALDPRPSFLALVPRSLVFSSSHFHTGTMLMAIPSRSKAVFLIVGQYEPFFYIDLFARFDQSVYFSLCIFLFSSKVTWIADKRLSSPLAIKSHSLFSSK